MNNANNKKNHSGTFVQNKLSHVIEFQPQSKSHVKQVSCVTSNSKSTTCCFVRRFFVSQKVSNFNGKNSLKARLAFSCIYLSGLICHCCRQSSTVLELEKTAELRKKTQSPGSRCKKYVNKSTNNLRSAITS